MGIPHSVTKGPLTAGAANNIALSQSPGAGAILLNGATAGFFSLAAGASALAGAVLILLPGVAVSMIGAPVSNATASGTIPSGSTVVSINPTTNQIQISRPIGGAGVTIGDTIVISGPAILDTQRRIILTSGGNDTGITFTISGAGDNGVPITDTVTGASGAAAISNLDFKTITGVTHTGTVAGTLTIGTTTNFAAGAVVAATPWFGVNWHAEPVNIELSGTVSGTLTWGWQYTYDDPNNLPPGVLFPQPFNHPTLNNITVSQDGAINDPVAAVRLVIISAATNTGSVRGTWMEAGISGQ